MLVSAGLSTADALRAATVNPAKLFPSQNAGAIVPGKRANLLLLDGSPLEDIANTRRIRAVVLRGRYLDRRRLDRLLQEAVQAAAGS